MRNTYPTFMHDSRNSEQGADYWSPEVTGDHAIDTETGKRYADEFIDTIREKENPTTLGHVVKAMMSKGEYTGVEIGFFHRIAERLIQN